MATAPTPLKVTHAASCTTEQPTLTLQLPTVAASTLLVGGIDVADALTQLMSSTGGGDAAGGTDHNIECGTSSDVEWRLGDLGDACDVTCSDDGLTCDGTALATNFTKPCITALAGHLGVNCFSTMMFAEGWGNSAPWVYVGEPSSPTNYDFGGRLINYPGDKIMIGDMRICIGGDKTDTPAYMSCGNGPAEDSYRICACMSAA